MTDLDRLKSTLKNKVFEISKSTNFESAHYLPNAANPDAYKNIHGHSFQLEVTLRGQLNVDRYWLEDFSHVSAALNLVKAQLDHKLLNEVEGLENPTLEGLCLWVTDYLLPHLPQLSKVTISRPSLGETCSLIVEESK